MLAEDETSSDHPLLLMVVDGLEDLRCESLVEDIACLPAEVVVGGAFVRPV